MQQAGPAGRERELIACGDLQHLQDMLSGIDFRMMGFWLRNAKQGVDFGQEFD